MTGRRAAVVLVVLAVSAVGCGVPEQGLQPIDRDELPPALRDAPAPTTAPPPAAPVVAELAWVRDRQLVVEQVPFFSSPSPSTLVSLLERGPVLTEPNVGLRSPLGGAEVIRGAERRGRAAVVRVGSFPTDLPEADQVLGLGQLVISLTSLPDVDEVVLEADGDRVDVPLPDGSLVRRPLQRSDYEPLLAPSSPPESR
jgi:hypothetical protein